MCLLVDRQLVDVGFGAPTPIGPIPLGGEATYGGPTWKTERVVSAEGEDAWLLSMSDMPLYTFTELDHRPSGLPRSELLHISSTGGHDPAEPDWDDPDPLRSTLSRFLDHATGPTSGDAQVAVRHWILAMAARYNDGHHWPHPASCRPFPPPLLAADLFDDPIN